MVDNLVKKIFYLTSIFAKIKSKNGWTSNELKTTLILMSKMSEYSMFFNKLDSEMNFAKRIESVPRTYVVEKKEFQFITGVKSSHAVREINKVREGLGTKIINTPHPLDEGDKRSGETIPWFSKISYLNKKGQLIFKFNEDAIERLLIFVKYSKINFRYLSLIKNHNAIFSYIFFKILKDSSKLACIVIDVDEFKERLSMSGKYIKISQFKEKVLEVIKLEINNFTDLDLDYFLIKERRSYSKIKFIFNYNKKLIYF